MRGLNQKKRSKVIDKPTAPVKSILDAIALLTLHFLVLSKKEGINHVVI
jgi:hypothetical protein